MSESFYRRNLPHWDPCGATYFVTMCLADSTPARGWLSPRRPENVSPSRGGCQPAGSRPASPGHTFAAFDKLLDTSPAVRWLEDRRLASVVVDALRWGAGSRYDLIAFAVMPNHVHWVFTPLVDRITHRRFRRLAITTALKRHTALTCNRLLNRRGRFWQAESYDRVVRDDEELERIVRYVEYNPVRAGLCLRAEDWEFSSARRRAVRGL